MKLEAELSRARGFDVDALADAIQEIGFECTRCGGCCKGLGGEEHTATVFPDEVRSLQAVTEYDWRDVARPMPFGLVSVEAESEATGSTFEWALQTDACGDCVFYEEADGTGSCGVHGDHPLICQTYPFSVGSNGGDSGALGSEPMGDVVEHSGLVRAHECEGLGRDIAREDAVELARTLKERSVRELEEMIAVRDNYHPVDSSDRGVVVHDSEGAKRPDGSRVPRDSP